MICVPERREICCKREYILGVHFGNLKLLIFPQKNRLQMT